jgi:hypothetical protein
MWYLYREVTDEVTYNSLVAEDSNVNFDYFISLDSNLEGFQKLNSIIDWDTYYSETTEEYGIARNEIHSIVETTTWDNLSHDEKMVAIKYRAYSDSTAIVMYLMGIGYSQVQAEGLLIQQGALEQVKLIEVCKERGTSYILYMIIGKYLSIGDQADLNTLVENLLFKYTEKGLRGTHDGRDGNLGIYDFLEGTVGTSYEIINIMTQGYTMQNGDSTAINLKNEILDWLRHGKHNF